MYKKDLYVRARNRKRKERYNYTLVQIVYFDMREKQKNYYKKISLSI